MSEITSMQKYALASAVEALAREAVEKVIDELEKGGSLNGAIIQRVKDNPHLAIKIMGFIKKLLVEMVEDATDRLRLISGAEILTLEPTDGTEVIAEEGRLFSGYLDSDFRNWNTNVKGNPKKVQNVHVHEMTKDGTFDQIYGSLGTDLNALCLTQAQIIRFFKQKLHNSYLIHEKPGDAGYAWFLFLFKVGNEFFVASVGVGSDGSLRAIIYRFLSDDVWEAESRRRFVVPQLNQ